MGRLALKLEEWREVLLETEKGKKRVLPERMNGLGKGSEARNGMARASAQLGT